MIETAEIYYKETDKLNEFVQPLYTQQDGTVRRNSGRPRLLGQVLRFGLVGVLNTVVDLLLLNILLLLFPTTNSLMLLAYNALAYSVGGVNSFLLNKYWTFGHKQTTSRSELVRFAITTLCGIMWSSIILWIASNVLHPILINPTVWANASKVFAIGGTALISYLGMRLWVFVNKPREKQTLFNTTVSDSKDALSDGRNKIYTEHVITEKLSSPVEQENDTSGKEPNMKFEDEYTSVSRHSLSVVLPAYNEEQVIAGTVLYTYEVLSQWHMDFEILVVNDGSADRTGAIVGELANIYPQIRLINHAANQGYGAALVSGFAAATKDLTFFMDSDGQFDIRDLRQFFAYIDRYDGVLGYRINRQDSQMRKFNAWGWKCLIGLVLDVHVRDIDCAFKLLPTEFLHTHPLETRGAMINAELLYKLKQAGCSYCEIGVHHLPRQAGQATGAKPSVILRALRELFVYARKWRQEESVISGARQELPMRSRV